ERDDGAAAARAQGRNAGAEDRITVGKGGNSVADEADLQALVAVDRGRRGRGGRWSGRRPRRGALAFRPGAADRHDHLRNLSLLTLVERGICMTRWMIVLALVVSSVARAAVPNTFSVQGVLRDGMGALQMMPVDVTVTLFDA